jgi:hypothetical protein
MSMDFRPAPSRTNTKRRVETRSSADKLAKLGNHLGAPPKLPSQCSGREQRAAEQSTSLVIIGMDIEKKSSEWFK